MSQEKNFRDGMLTAIKEIREKLDQMEKMYNG